MKSQEQINKIEAVVLYILQHFKEGLDYIKLFKIMYFAQREYLATYGLTIAEDTFKARQLGPVPSLTYKVVKMAENGEQQRQAETAEQRCACHFPIVSASPARGRCVATITPRGAAIPTPAMRRMRAAAPRLRGG